MLEEIKLENLGDGLEGGIVSELFIKIGDKIKKDSQILELETDKAVLPIPASQSGAIKTIHVKEGDQLKIGSLLYTLEVSAMLKEKTSSEKTVISVKNETLILPDLGEGIEGGIVSSIEVSLGDQVSEEQSLFELETDKASVVVPSKKAGVITEILIKENQEIKVGEPIFVLQFTPSTSLGTLLSEESEEALKSPPPSIESAPLPQNKGISQVMVNTTNVTIAAGPATRKLARELGVDLKNVKGTARGGRIVLEDVKQYVKSTLSGKTPKQTFATKEMIDFSSFGKVEKIPLSNLRKKIAKNLSFCWQNIPHVHQFQDIDVTKIVDFQKEKKLEFKEKGSMISVTSFVIEAMAMVLKEEAFARFNASYDEGEEEIIFKKYVNIGVAVDTPEGLIVPVLKKVDEMNVFNIGKNLKELAKKTRERKVHPADLKGSSMTLSNLGGIGGTFFTPIINWPEVAILGIGRNTIKPYFINGKWESKSILPTVLAYDHRVIDGADGARFIVKLTEILENPDFNRLGLPS